MFMVGHLQAQPPASPKQRGQTAARLREQTRRAYANYDANHARGIAPAAGTEPPGLIPVNALLNFNPEYITSLDYANARTLRRGGRAVDRGGLENR